MNISPPSIRAAMSLMNKRNLKSSAVVQHETTTPAPGGATRTQWVNRLTDPLPCRVSAPQAADQEMVVAHKIEPHRAVFVIFEAGADVLLTDRFVVTTESGDTITVYAVGRAVRDAEVMRKLLCEWRG